MDLMYLLYSLLRKKWIIIFCTLLAILGAFIFTMFQEKSYLSFAQYSTGFTMQQKVKINQDQNFNLYEIELRFNNVIETFRSPKVIGMLSYKLLLHDLESPQPFRRLTEEQKTSEVYKAANIEEAKRILQMKIAAMELINPFDTEEKKIWDLIALFGYDVESLKGKMNFARVINTDFINIFFVSENPELSAYVVNTIGEQFLRFFSSIYGVRSRDATGKLDSLANAKKREVDSLTLKLKEFRTGIGTPNIADKATAAMGVVQEQITNYQREKANLNNLRGELIAVQLQLKNLKPASPVSQANNNAEILSLRKKNGDLEADKIGKTADEIKKIDDQISSNYRRILQLNGGNNPNRITEDQKNQLKREELLDRKIELEQQIAAAEATVAFINTQKQEYEKLINQGGGEQVILAAKEQELRQASQEYERFKNSLQSSLDLDVNPENNLKQILMGQPAYQPEPARRALIVGLSGVLMLFLSSLIILLLEFLDTSYKTPSIFQRATKLKLLSSINRIDLKKRPLEDYFHSNGEVDRQENGNTFVENLRKLRYELERSGKKIFLVTSTKPKEGKTTIIESLANSLSLSKKKVLLVDANFSNNTLTQKFQAKPTLEQFSLNGQSTAMEKFAGITSDTRIPNIDIIGCNEGNYTPSEVLPKNNVLENLQTVSERYDFVLVEGAALNDHADSKELSKYVDGIITIFSVQSGLKQIDKDSIKFLKSTGDQFIGTVLNKVEEENLDL